MNTRNTILAVVIFAVLLGAVLLMNPAQNPTSAVPSPTPVGTVTALKQEDVTAVTVKTNDGKTIAVQKDQSNNWQITQPVTGEGDRTRIVGVVAAMIGRPPERKVADNAANLGEFGLASPVYTVDLVSGAGTETYLVGNQSPTQSGAYMVKQGGSTVWLISGLDRTLKDYVDRPPKAEPTPTPVPTIPPTATPVPVASGTPSP